VDAQGGNSGFDNCDVVRHRTRTIGHGAIAAALRSA
jgi:hypothetical protein